MTWDKQQSRRRANGPRSLKKRSLAVESLEERALLAGPPIYTPPMNPPVISPPVISPPLAPMPAPTTPPITMPTSPPTTIPANPPSTPPPAPSPIGAGGDQTQRLQRPSGIVSKSPHFYEFYTGPKLAELNAIRASAGRGREVCSPEWARKPWRPLPSSWLYSEAVREAEFSSS